MELVIKKAVREGYTESINILVEGRTTYERIDQLTTVQAGPLPVFAWII